MSERPDVGSVGEEAAKLLAALQEWAHDGVSHGIADGSEACRLCPLCQLIAWVRRIEPDAVDQVADNLRGMVHALRALVDAIVATGAAGDREPGVQRIRLGEEDEDIPWE